MTQKSKSQRPKRLRPVAVSPVLWECPSHIYAVADEDSQQAVLRKHGIPESHWHAFLGGPDGEMAAALAEVQYYEGGALIIVSFGPEVFGATETGKLHTSVMSTILHEAVHVFQRVCDLVGEEDPGREVEAYAIETITRHLTDAFMTLQAQKASQTSQAPADVAPEEQKREDAPADVAPEEQKPEAAQDEGVTRA